MDASAVEGSSAQSIRSIERQRNGKVSDEMSAVSTGRFALGHAVDPTNLADLVGCSKLCD